MNTRPQQLLTKVCSALDSLVAAGRPYHGLFPSLLDRRSGAMLTVLPPAIPGQRDWDRAHLGNNLIHDEATLKTLYALADALGRPEYAVAANRYLQRFATHCTDTATGLFPWGEHSFWHLTGDRVGNCYALTVERPMTESAIHDQLRQTPVWLWEKLWQFNPRCVERFAEGLDFHWQEGKREEYIRHANIEQRTHPTPYARRGIARGESPGGEAGKSFQYPTLREYAGAIYLTVTQGDYSDSHKERIMFGKLEDLESL